MCGGSVSHMTKELFNFDAIHIQAMQLKQPRGKLDGTESTCIEEDSSILAFSAASFSLCMAMLSLEMSIPCCTEQGIN